MTPLTPPPSQLPSRSRPATFAADGDALIAWLSTFVSEMNVRIGELATTINDSVAAVTAARTPAVNAVNSSRESALLAIGNAGASALAAVNDVLSTLTPMVNAVLTAHEAAVNLPSTGGTSTSTQTVGQGVRLFGTQPGKNWRTGQYVNVARTSNPAAIWMSGTVVSYDTDSGFLNVYVDDLAGTGTFNDWAISLAARAKALPPRVFISSDTAAVDGTEYIFLGACSLILPNSEGTVYFNNLSGTRNCWLRRANPADRIEGLLEDMRLNDKRAGGAITKINSAKGWCLQ